MEQAQSVLYLNKRLAKLTGAFKPLKLSLNGRLIVVVYNMMMAKFDMLVKSYAFASSADVR